jgi:pimeloyl-ACP methyl ester carboxylesterase
MTEVETGYAPVNELSMYYEVHGEGRPLILLHGAYMTVDMFGPFLGGLAEGRQVIAPELHGHGRTADVDRPITYPGMADDVAALIRHLGIEQADVVGYSLGGATAVQVAIRHPELVRRLVVISAGFSSDAAPEEAQAMFETITPEMFAGSPMEAEFVRLNPRPEDFPKLVEKITALDTTPFDWSQDVRNISAPTLIVVGDSDGSTLDHTIEFFKLRGGGVMGDLAGLPESQLIVLPGTTHFIPPGYGVMDRHEWLLPMVRTFLDPAEPPPGPMAP